MSFFTDVPFFPPDPIFGLTAGFLADPRPEKVNLTVGQYKTPDLFTPVMAVVKKAESFLLENEMTKEYLSTEGEREYIDKAAALTFGDFWKEKSRIAGAQTIGGTGALRVSGEFLKQEICENIYIPDPSWLNHRAIFTKSGLKVENYPYYDRKKNVVDFDGLVSFLKKVKEKSAVVLHGCCHNPTGADLTMEQWKVLSDLFLNKKLFPFFDFAYQGFGTNIEEDAKAIRFFAKQGHEMLVCISFSKNFGLYAERIGALFIVTSSTDGAERVMSSIKSLIRANVSNPAAHGSRIVSHILGNHTLRKEWETELAAMRARVVEMRKALSSSLVDKCKTRDFSFLNDRSGLFSYSGLSEDQVERLKTEYAIYMTKDGRINVCGLNWHNLGYVVEAITEICKT